MADRLILFRRPVRLRWHLVLLVCGALLPVVAFAAIVVRQLASSEQAVIERRLLRSARELTVVLDREMSVAIRVLSALAQSERLEQGDLRAFYSEARRVSQTQPAWLAVLVFGPDGRQLFSTAQPWGTPPRAASEPASLHRVLQTRQPVVGNLAPGLRRGLLAFPIRVPVLQQGELRYVLTAVITPEALASLVVPQDAGNEEWTRTVLDGQGVVVARTRQPERFVGRSGSPAFLKRIREHPEGFSRETTLDGTPVYTAFSRSRFSNWTTLIAVPRGVLEGPARDSLLLVAGLGLALLALSGLGTFLYSRPLSRSIESAAEAADTLARGGRPAVVPSAVKEVTHLAQALERSADLLLERERERNEHLLRAEAARAEAEAASRAKDEFLAMLGHELRNPLGPIRNGVQLLSELLPPDERAERVRGMIERQVVHITRMVDDLLETSRITRGKIVLKKRSLDLRLVVREVCEDFRPRFDQAGIALSCTPPPPPQTPVWVEGDETRLGQCLGNLLHNALKFTPAKGKVSVSLTTAGENASLEVRDDGCGIDPALLPSLFQPFAQGPQSLDRSQGGLGLGLALVKGLVELHGGTVRAESAGSGKGSCFTILLPLALPRDEPVQDSPPRDAFQNLRHRVLVVEDLRDAAESLEMLLSLAGHDVKIALNGREALEIAPEHEPGVVVCDIGLPDMDGYTLCRKLREIPALRGATFIALTGYGQAEDVRRAHDAGFTIHLTKPVEPAVLREVLDLPARAGLDQTAGGHSAEGL